MPSSSALAPFLEKIHRHRQSYREERLRSAFALAADLYAGKEHWTGDPLVEHALGVIDILLPFQPDEDTVVACLFQHALETKTMTLDHLEERCGPVVRSLVSSIHLLSHVTLRDRRRSIEDLRLMLLGVTDDIRVLLVILADRCEVLHHLEKLPSADCKRIAREVLGLFAPVAARLGIHTLKQRLELLAFPIVYPSDAESIAEQFAELHERYGEFLTEVAQILQAELKAASVDAAVDCREKQPYSVFTKMRAKSLSHIEKLHDLFALRVIVSEPAECYQTLGVLHRLGRPVANRFKDYIALPKPNGYQSLHTTIARLPGVPEGVLVEAQVRTHAMHREAEYGIAAHWSYKEGGAAERAKLQQVLSAQHAVKEEGRSRTLADHIFVLTPKGDIVELPEGATPLDFAFQIHTTLGLAFRSARVNGVIAPIDHALENGDIIEIQTHASPKPSPEWMQLLKMASSRSRLKRYLYSLNRAQFVAAGRTLVNAELNKHRLSPLDPDLTLLRAYDGRILSFADREDILMKIGQGSEKPASLLLNLDKLRLPSIANAPLKAPRTRRRDDRIVEMEDGVPMPYRFAKCCKPQEKDHPDLLGFITRTGDVSLHVKACRMVKNANPERRVGVRWGRNES
ncbi:bifunctional (p)ppGpp synthetase/guanosine-3',5'-bis(diphosphate) 3'-pyrophosphohydrolase [Candidatus Peregrinibacteria bacterium]|nr:bifunctional (p)ppGpp synthetase/guanosine-3',5'-bis(diphosphate) 3'-pyrophosphohydrolase [Candidatus Peregrinibacteria bacterium]